MTPVNITGLHVRMSQEYKSYLDYLGAQLDMQKPEAIEAGVLMLAKSKGLKPPPPRLNNPMQSFISQNQ